MENIGKTICSNTPKLSPAKIAPTDETKRIREPIVALVNEQGDERGPKDRALKVKQAAIVDAEDDTLTLVKLPLPSNAKQAKKALRAHLGAHLGTHTLTEHGREVCIQLAPTHHLPKQQAKLWEELPRQQAADVDIKSTPPTQDIIDAAPFIKQIAYQLGQNQVFIKKNPAVPLPCSLHCCTEVREANGNPPHDGLLVIEPFVDALTVRPINSKQAKLAKYLTFERVLVSKLSVYYPTLKKMIKLDTCGLGFCSYCLDYLWDRRVIAWACLDAKESAVSSGDVEHNIQRRIEHFTYGSTI
ncbi:hypothetical protein P154DRAFT_580589 [Amniculicola lignicola CBS 123094]|uniref:Uncharacterized protein n=1 Tax=Amniculicola lignicola CBS 123094 TaxID=1392246 RepID=A0A6A5WDJ6_9PLEO|nr:hypothetical protein P154DRAFT_580589 [Amniculicola lignicola CBS 123094]